MEHTSLEVWKSVEGYEEYEVSSFWNVMSLNYHMSWKSKLLKPGNSKWYKKVRLSKDKISKNFSIHRLVALAFLENPENKPQVNHINGIKSDNRIDNLEFATANENMQHASKTWLQKVGRWVENPLSKPLLQFSKAGEFIREFWGVSEVGRDLWINQGNISECCHWNRKSAGWFIWRLKQ